MLKSEDEKVRRVDVTLITESLNPGFPEANPRNVSEGQENPQNLLRQQEAKTRAWFTLFLVKQNCWFKVLFLLPEYWY